MKQMGLAIPTLITASVICAILVIFPQCIRNNPLDANGDEFIPGKRPHVQFLQHQMSAFIGDSLSITITASDTAVGGQEGPIRLYYFDWGINQLFGDSIPGTDTDTLTITKSFGPGTITVRVKALDYEGEWSDIDSAQLVIVRSEPRIVAIRAATITGINVPVVARISATDTGGVILWYLWAKDGTSFKDSTGDSLVTLSFSEPGLQTVLVKVKDNKGTESAIDTLRVLVVEKPDTLGPSLTFLSPQNGDSLGLANIMVYVQAQDETNVETVSLNGLQLQQTDLIWKGPATLLQGRNTLIAIAKDSKGNSRVDSIVVFLVTDVVDRMPPLILFKVPSRNPDTVNSPDLTIRAQALDESGIAAVLINNSVMEYDSTDGYYYHRSVLSQGANDFSIQSIDGIGNVGWDTLSITYVRMASDTVPPVLLISYPANFMHIRDTLITVTGSAMDPSGILSAYVNATKALMTYPNWAAPLVLHHGTNSIVVTAVDSSSGQNRASDSVTIVSNYPPGFVVRSGTLDTQCSLAVPYAISISAADADGDSLFFRLLPLLFHSTNLPVMTASDTGVTLGYIPNAPGTDVFRLEVKDEWNDADTLEWNVTVLPGNRSPVLATSGNKTVDEMKLLQFSLAASDSDHDVLVYSFGSGFPAGARLDSAVFSWTPTNKQAGVYTVVFVVKERNRYPALADSQSITITVNNVNVAPVLVNPGNKMINETKLLQITLSASDADGGVLIYSVANAPLGATLTGNEFKWRPAIGKAGVYTLEFRVTDNGVPVLSNSQSITITVTARGDD